MKLHNNKKEFVDTILLIAEKLNTAPAILQEIIDKEIYRKDYESITEKVLFDNISYFEAIKSLDKIIASGVFESDDEYILI